MAGTRSTWGCIRRAVAIACLSACSPSTTSTVEPTPPEPVAAGSEHVEVSGSRDEAAPVAVDPALVWTNRGFTDASLDPSQPAFVWTELPGARETDLARVRALHTQLPSLYSCLRRALGTSPTENNLHVRIVARDGELTLEESPRGFGAAECVRAAASRATLSTAPGLVASLAMIRPRFSRVLPLAEDAPNLVRGLGGCHWFEVSHCGPEDDCPMDGYRAGICPASSPASSVLNVERASRGRAVTSVSRVGADGAPTYVASLPFALPTDADTARFELPDAQRAIDWPNLQGAATDSIFALLADTGTLVIRRGDGEVRFAEALAGEESFGWDDAEGSVTVGGTRCPFESSRHGRAAVFCVNRFVLVRGESTVFVLDERGTVLERKVLTPSYPGIGRLHPHLEGRIERVSLVLDGHVYIR